MILLVLMLIVPPWKATREGGFFGKDRTVKIGYQLIFDPPSQPDAAMDGTLLFVQIFALAIVSGALFILLKDRQKA